MGSRKKILFLVTEDWYFCSHRLPLAIAAREAGYEVAVATRVVEHGDRIRRAGITLIPLRKLKRSSFSIMAEASAILEIAAIYRQERPDLVHQVAIKPVVYGSIAAIISGVARQVNALAGLGFIYSSGKPLARALRPLISWLLKILLDRSGSRTIVQNVHDLEQLSNTIGIDSTRIHLIRGAGVDMAQYCASPIPPGQPIAILASRMLWDKGIGEFVSAARLLKAKGCQARFVLVGTPDPENPTSISEDQLRTWHTEGDVEWWGYQSEMPQVLSLSHLVCLPTYYGEGIPKVLIEAMSCGRAIITTATPGCKELVVNDANGLLIPPRDVNALANAMEKLLQDTPRCEAMGAAGRSLAESSYASERIHAETIRIYRELLD